ncbi:hypothetical protein [Nonomuraea sp. NEAU-A123]|uniref:hypothetical protein n=1 Tax=Nonomuraea sp. NEAU-A123 TaxID=2839649 RepID=UPI001BE43CAF|nr:hypothetical protein [Nonomuraea sp. NEAU-A123]MBT2227722.1 hypothetical protein [Nonomuraea sp. NEAU-A123]
MKRTIVGVAVVAGLMQLTATPAQAAPRVDPVKALKAELTRGKAVNVVSTAKVNYGSGLSISAGMDGTIGFGPRGEIASDLSQTLKYSKKLMGTAKEVGMADDAALQQAPLRMISSGYDDYVSGPLVNDALPQGTRWVRYRDTDLPASDLLLEVLEPATLKTLLAHRTSWRDGVLKGTIKTDKLAKVSPSFVSHFGIRSKSGRVGKVSYTIRLGPTGLVERLSAIAVLPIYDGSVRIESDTRYSDWGRQVTVLLPLNGDVIDRQELEEEELPYELPGIWS